MQAPPHLIIGWFVAEGMRYQIFSRLSIYGRWYSTAIRMDWDLSYRPG